MYMRIKGVLVSFLCLCSISCVFGHFCVGGYEVVAEGKTIGFVDNAEIVLNLTEKINDTLVNDYGDSAGIEDKITLVEKADLKAKVSTEEELVKEISGLSEFMSEAYVLVVNGERTAAFENYHEMIKALQIIYQKHEIEDSETGFCEKIEYETDYISNARLNNAESGAEYIENNNLISVKSEVNMQYPSAVPFETVRVEDDTMYKGSIVVLQEGEAGESVVTANISYINGEEISRETVSESVRIQPVKEILSVGTLEPPPGFGTGRFIQPVSGRLTSEYGQRWGRLHGGIDLAAAEKTPISAADNGKVIFAGDCGSYGLLVKLDHGNGYVTYYAHCSQINVSVGDCVTKGETIALVGNTGNSTGPHCHFEIRYNNKQLNPLDFLN